MKPRRKQRNSRTQPKDMADNVGRTRLGKLSAAHGSARRELATKAPPRKRGCRPTGQHASSSGVHTEPQQQPQQQDVDAYVDDESDLVDIPPPPPPREQPREEEEREEEQEQEEPQQVYGGGPTDLSILVEYHKHRAVKIWNRNASFEKSLKCLANGKKVINIPKPDDGVRWFWDAVTATGLEPLVRTNFSIIDHGMNTAFCERWHPETSTFHLPVGEATITLDDVQCLLHLPIEGKFLNHKRMVKDEANNMLCTFLGCDVDDVDQQFHDTNGPHVTYSYLQQIYMENLEKAEAGQEGEMVNHEIRRYRDQCIRAFLLYVVSCTIFSNKSTNWCDVVYLQFFQDLTTVREWNWGAAALVYIQKYLNDGSAAKVKQMSGYLSFLQGWVIEHFPSLSMWMIDPNYEETQPRCAKYIPGQGHPKPYTYRKSIDNMEMADFVFSPYTDHRHIRPLTEVCWYSGWLRSGSWKGKHLPERVLRQYGYVQTIPRHPTQATPPMNVFQIDRVFQEELDLRMIDENMRGEMVVNRWDHSPGYIAWYYKVSHPKVVPPQVPNADPPRPADLEFVMETQAANDDLDTYAMFRDIRDWSLNSMATGEVVEGSPAWITMNRIAERALPGTVYSRRR